MHSNHVALERLSPVLSHFAYSIIYVDLVVHGLTGQPFFYTKHSI